MDKLRFYRVDADYVKYLYIHADKRVQYKPDARNGYNKRRPYVGIVILIDGLKYFAPLEHPRNSHKKLKSNPHILKIDNGNYGLIAFGNMIPVPDECLVEFDINGEEEPYKKILIRQLIFCRKTNPIFI